MTLPAAIEHIRGGRLRALGVTSLARNPALPAVPTLAESGLPDFDATSWFGLFAPRGTPEAVVALLHREVSSALASDTVRQRLAELGAEPRPMDPAGFGAFVAAERERWAAAVKASGARMD